MAAARSDGVCVSYPKSGRTWLRFMLPGLGVELDYSHMGTGASSREWGHRFEDLPLEVDAGAGSGRPLLFLHRDPRDTVVSFWHEMRRRQMPLRKPESLQDLEAAGKMPPEDLDAFVRSERFGIDKLCRFNLWCMENLGQAYRLSYEALRRDPAGGLAGLLAFLGRPADPDGIARMVAQGSFDAMKRMETSGQIPAALHKRLGAVDPEDPDSYKVRRGIVGNWQAEMAPETIAYAAGRLAAHDYFRRMG